MMTGNNKPEKEITQAPQSPTLQLAYKKQSKIKKIFSTRNLFEVLSQTESIEVDTTASNPISEINNL